MEKEVEVEDDEDGEVVFGMYCQIEVARGLKPGIKERERSAILGK